MPSKFRYGLTSAAVSIFVSFFVSSPALALNYPLPKPGMSAQGLPPNFTANYDFEGIIALSNCSGSFVRFESSRDSDRGMVLTNGHCLEGGFPAPGKYVYGKASSRRMTLLDRAGNPAGTVNALRVMYGTMTKTDMALYQLRETYGEIERRFNIRPLTLTSKHPSLQTAIEVVSGYWRRGFRCAIDAFIPQLKEDYYTCEDSIRYTQPGCETYGGTSGSPVIEAGTRTVIGVNNTGNEDGRRCSMNNPCEIDESGQISYQKGRAYGQQIYWVYSCLTGHNEIDLNIPGCELFH